MKDQDHFDWVSQRKQAHQRIPYEYAPRVYGGISTKPVNRQPQVHLAWRMQAFSLLHHRSPIRCNTITNSQKVQLKAPGKSWIIRGRQYLLLLLCVLNKRISGKLTRSGALACSYITLHYTLFIKQITTAHLHK